LGQLCSYLIAYFYSKSHLLLVSHKNDLVFRFIFGKNILMMSPTEERNLYIRSIKDFKKSPNEFSNFLKWLLDKHVAGTYSCGYSEGYRARNSKCETISDIWYCPPKLTPIGRFNKVGETLLYTCDDPIATIKEIGAVEGEIITLATIKPKDSNKNLINIAHLGMDNNILFGADAMANLQANPNFRPDYLAAVSGNNDSDSIHRLNLNCALNLLLSNICTDNFEFDDAYNRYEYTNILWDYYRKIPNVEGLMYPSIATDRTSINIAILPAVADKVFKIDRVFQFEMTSELKVLNPDLLNSALQNASSRHGVANYITGRIDWY